MGKTKKVVVVQCKHCGKANGHVHHRSLCYTCYKKPQIRFLYPTTSEVVGKKLNHEEPVQDVYKRILAAWSNHPLWQPAEFPRDDPRFNELVDARRAANLPAIHPGDPKPNLE